MIDRLKCPAARLAQPLRLDIDHPMPRLSGCSPIQVRVRVGIGHPTKAVKAEQDHDSAIWLVPAPTPS